MNRFNAVELIATLQEWAESLSFEEWLHITGYSIAGLCSLTFIYSVIIIVMRIFGLYHPKYYRLFPRLPWRLVFRLCMPFKAWHERTFKIGQFATGNFSSALAVLSQIYRPGKVLLGRAYAFGFPLLQPVGVRVTRHIKIFAMTGAGKTVALISIIACWSGSTIIVDPKGQITHALARLDRKRQWFAFDPYGITNLPCINFNVFDVIKKAWEQMGDTGAVLWAERVAYCLITVPEGSKVPYFYEISRAFVVGLILHILTAHDESEHHLPFMRSLKIQGYRVFNNETGEEETKGKEAFLLLLDTMMHNPAFDGTIIGAATAVKNAGGETLGNVLSTMQQQTRWLDLPLLRKHLKTSDFSLASLKARDDIVLSLVSPVLSVRGELKEIFRLFINMSAYTFEITKQKKGQCLFAVDEFPSLGYNEIFEVILPVARSQGITFLGISQDIEILKKAYPKTWETYIGNADCVICMGTNHQATLEYLSKVLGQKNRVEKDRYSGRKIYHRVPVAEADQLRRFLDPDAGRILVLRPGKRAMRLMNDPHFKALPITHYDADPDHKETWPRRFMRTLLKRKQATLPHENPSPNIEPESEDMIHDDINI